MHPQCQIVIFGDHTSVFSQVYPALKAFNKEAKGKRCFTQPVLYTYHKLNKNHKGVGAVAAVTEHALVFYWGNAPKVKQDPVPCTTLIPGSRCRPSELFKDPDTNEAFNPTQKPYGFLHPFIRNSLSGKDQPMVIDLTTGSSASLFATYTYFLDQDEYDSPVLWLGCDIDHSALRAFQTVTNLLKSSPETKEATELKKRLHGK